MHYGRGWNETAGGKKSLANRKSACSKNRKPQVALWKQGLSQELVDRMYYPGAGNDSSPSSTYAFLDCPFLELHVDRLLSFLMCCLLAFMGLSNLNFGCRGDRHA